MNILLLKEPKGQSDPYLLNLKDIGQVDFVPVLSIKLTNLEALKNLLCQDRFDCIIFTSGNSVKAVKSVFEASPPSSVADWTKMKCYVVGKATEKLATELHFECSGSDCGNAEELAKLIIKENPETSGKRFLFPCGQIKREVLPSLLKEAGVDLNCLAVYETSENPHIFEAITNSSRENKNPTIAVFFSPSGVCYALPKLRIVYGEGLKDLHCAAIGQTTAEALQVAGINPCCVAKHPSPGDLRNAIKSFSTRLISVWNDHLKLSSGENTSR